MQMPFIQVMVFYLKVQIAIFCLSSVPSPPSEPGTQGTPELCIASIAATLSPITRGPHPSADSYLNIPALISAAEVTHADAIHPGYGFLKC
jgi:hypothetical protein